MEEGKGKEKKRRNKCKDGGEERRGEEGRGDEGRERVDRRQCVTRKEGEKRGSNDTTQRASRVQDNSDRTREGQWKKKRRKKDQNWPGGR